MSLDPSTTIKHHVSNLWGIFLMAKLLYALGLLQIIGGVLIAMAAKSAIHEILGAIAFGMGVLALGIGAVISRIAEVGLASEKQVGILSDIKDGRRV